MTISWSARKCIHLNALLLSLKMLTSKPKDFSSLYILSPELLTGEVGNIIYSQWSYFYWLQAAEDDQRQHTEDMSKMEQSLIMKDEVIRYDNAARTWGCEASVLGSLVNALVLHFGSHVFWLGCVENQVLGKCLLHIYPIFLWLFFRQLEDVNRRTENIEVRRLKEDLRTSRMEIEWAKVY